MIGGAVRSAEDILACGILMGCPCPLSRYTYRRDRSWIGVVFGSLGWWIAGQRLDYYLFHPDLLVI